MHSQTSLPTTFTSWRVPKNGGHPVQAYRAGMNATFETKWRRLEYKSNLDESQAVTLGSNYFLCSSLIYVAGIISGILISVFEIINSHIRNCWLFETWSIVTLYRR